MRYLAQSRIDDDYEEEYDLIGISSLTDQAKIAFQIADTFMERGRKVVMGGIHPTMFPDQAAEHCDAVVIGEAEMLWPKVLRDAQNNCLEKFYKHEQLPELSGIPSPRFELLDLSHISEILHYPVLTSKGCPNHCEFCFIPELFKGKLRNRPVEDVLHDIRSVKERMNSNKIDFVDDNIIGNRKLARDLFREMIPLNVKWNAQCTLDIAEDRDLLDLATQSGCNQLSIGLETINPASLVEVGKKFNIVERYPDQIREIQNRKIFVVANMLFGLEHDTKQTIRETAESLIRWKTHFMAPFILRPIMGTRLFKRLEREGRLLPEVTSEYTFPDVATFVPKHMSPEELEEMYRETNRRFYSLPSIFRRLLFPPRALIFRVLLLNLLANLKLIQWPRIKHTPVLGRVFSPLKSFLKTRVLSKRSKRSAGTNQPQSTT